MVWARPPGRRSLAVNGDFLRSCRERCGWTQSELAQQTGFSERLIRKAEASGKLRPESIERLSAVLTTDSSAIYPEDLTFHPAVLTQEILATYVCRQAVASRAVDEMVDSAVVCWCSGESRALPFAGEYRGREEFHAFWSKFPTFFAVPEPSSFAPRMLVDGNEVLVMGDGHEFTSAQENDARIWWILHCSYTRGLLVHCAIYMDTLRAMGALPGNPACRPSPD